MRIFTSLAKTPSYLWILEDSLFLDSYMRALGLETMMRFLALSLNMGMLLKLVKQNQILRERKKKTTKMSE